MELYNIFEKKIDIASKLNSGELGGSYFEAMMILSSVISAIASILWPGAGIDRRRFVELLILKNTTEYKFSTISIPHLNESHFLSEQQKEKLLRSYNSKSRSLILAGQDIDLDGQIIESNFVDMDVKNLRKYSYANLFYTEIRSGLVHEYSISDKSASYPMTSRDVFVSYNNNLQYPHRRIVFHFEYVKTVVKNIAINTTELVLENQKLNLPQTWWLDGG